MYPINKIILIPIFFLLLSPAYSQRRLEYIVDFSQSMSEQVESGQSKAQIAAEAILNSVAALPTNTEVAVRVFGHTIGVTDQQKSCLDSELLLPFGADRSSLKDSLLKITPLGFTSLAYSLSKAKDDFQTNAGNKAIIVLTDGEESCGGDPLAEARKLRDAGFDVRIDTVGIALSGRGKRDLEEIAKLGSGTYKATDSKSVHSDLAKISAESSSFLSRPYGDLDSDTDAGSDTENASTITPRRYLFNYLGSADMLDVFKLEVSQGEKYLVTIKLDAGYGAHPTMLITDPRGVTLFKDDEHTDFELQSDVLAVTKSEAHFITVAIVGEARLRVPYVLEVKMLVDL